MESMWYDSSCCYNNIMHTKDVAEEIIPYYFWKVCQCNTIFSKAKASGTVLLLWKKKKIIFLQQLFETFPEFWIHFGTNSTGRGNPSRLSKYNFLFNLCFHSQAELLSLFSVSVCEVLTCHLCNREHVVES